jgi:hypothetical protein
MAFAQEAKALGTGPELCGQRFWLKSTGPAERHQQMTGVGASFPFLLAPAEVG